MRSAAEGFELTEHPAEIGIRAWAETRERALCLGLQGLVSIMTEPSLIEPREPVSFSVASGAEADVLRRALSEALFLMSAGNEFLTSFSATWNADEVTVSCFSEPMDPQRHELRVEVKAITPAGLCFEREDDRWSLQVLVDV